MENKKLLKKELQPLKEYQEKINIIIVSLGKLDLQINSLENTKKNLIKEYQELETSQQKTALELQNKYGEGNIDLESGEFTPIA
tara:strand:- start:124 stop:375 length:252 start_codon:yes stop_codon:yes gene_type:complete